MHIHAVDIDIAIDGSSPEIYSGVCRTVGTGPLSLKSVKPEAPGLWRCRFVLMRPDLVVGYRSVVEMQSRLADVYDIVRVACVVEPQAA